MIRLALLVILLAGCTEYGSPGRLGGFCDPDGTCRYSTLRCVREGTWHYCQLAARTDGGSK